MAYIGNNNVTQGFIPAVDYFNGDGATVAFTLSRPVASVAQVQAVIENVPQAPGSAYTVSGNTITFTSAPPLGTGNIYVYYTSPITQVIQPGQGTVGQRQLDVATGNGTGAMYIPSGTTAQRPSSPVIGYTRYNTTLQAFEYYNGTSWQPLVANYTYPISYLVVGGGASGSASHGGGGGAGGVISSTANLNLGSVYTITVGAGGVASGTQSAIGVDGNSSSISGTLISTVTAGGGGGAGIGFSSSTTSGRSGLATNGNGGGAGGGTAAGTGGSGSGAGFAGGNSVSNGTAGAGGGGGGAGAVGSNATGAGGGGAIGGVGGAGIASSITGTSVTYAGGGGGGGWGTTGANGGAGGGGKGGNPAQAGTAGTANTGGGGGGSGDGSGTLGGNGGSGVVILSMLTASYSGITTGSPTVTTSGFNTILTFTTSGTYTA